MECGVEKINQVFYNLRDIAISRRMEEYAWHF